MKLDYSTSELVKRNRKDTKTVYTKWDNLPAAIDQVHHEIDDESKKYSQKITKARLDIKIRVRDAKQVRRNMVWNC